MISGRRRGAGAGRARAAAGGGAGSSGERVAAAAPGARSARRWRPGPTLGSEAALRRAARGRGSWRGRGAGAQREASHWRWTWTRAARHSAKNLQLIVGVVNLRPEQYWGRWGSLSLGCPWEPRVCPGETPIWLRPWPVGHCAAPVLALRGREAQAGPWGADTRGCRRGYTGMCTRSRAATRTPNSKLPTDHSRGRPGRSGGHPHPARDALPEPAPALPPRRLVRRALQCKFQRDKLLINSLEEKRVFFFLLFLICFHFCMPPSYALGSLAAQQFPLHFNILKKMQSSTMWPF